MDQQSAQYKQIVINKQIRSISLTSLFIAIGFFIYIFQITSISTKGFVITELEKNIKILENENKSLTLELANAKKISNLEEYSKSRNMVGIDKINYITLTSNVAMK